jgi:CTP synthase (UTP-ammonia lyase)
MEPRLSIGVIGEFNPEFPPHPATNSAIEYSASSLGIEVEVRWLDTASLEDWGAAELAAFDALWCAPGSPYRSLDGAVRVISSVAKRACRFSAPAGASNTR